MITLNRECFSKEWINAKSRNLRTGNTFLEKCLHAFELLGRLQQEGLNFVFKGGTSLLLRLPTPKRLSIDIDIVCKEKPERLERILKRCVSTPFISHEEDERRHNRPPRRRHWNFQYNSINPEGSREPYVILDVLEEDVLYSDVSEISIQTAFIEPDHAIRVKVPSVDNLLADKLTAFAPETIGQEYSKEHTEKILKHLFDIGELFDNAVSVHAIRNVYKQIASAEIEYRKHEKTLSIDECLDNTIETARLVTGMVVGQEFDAERCERLRTGISNLTGHLMGDTRFRIREAAIAAGKTAFIAASIKHDAMKQLDQTRFDPALQANLAGKTLAHFSELNNLAQANIEAFHYWCLADELKS